MFNYLRQHGEKGQTAVLLALSMIGLLAIVGLALDGGMLYWNQRRAQNGADAAAIAGVTKLADHVLEETCGSGTEQEILALVQEYAGVNEVPDAESGQNVEAFYLVENDDGDRVDLIYPATGKPWQVGETGSIPCDEDPVGLRVRASFPQQTFLAGVVGIAETNVTVDASAIFTTRTWCDEFVLLALDDADRYQVLQLTGASIHVLGGGVHSNGGIHISGGGQDMTVEPSTSPIEYGEDKTKVNISNKMEYPERIGEGDPIALDESWYDFADFAPDGMIWNEVEAVDPTKVHYIDGDLTDDDVSYDDFTTTPPTKRYIDGLYVVTGDVHLNQDQYRAEGQPPWRVTIAAKGTIQSSGRINVLPYARGVLFYTESKGGSPNDIKMSGASNRWAGLILAPNGDIHISGADNSDLAGMLIAQRIAADGANVTFQYHPNYCPPDPPKVLLIE